MGASHRRSRSSPLRCSRKHDSNPCTFRKQNFHPGQPLRLCDAADAVQQMVNGALKAGISDALLPIHALDS